MNDARYAPPAVRVDDPAIEGPLERPRIVVLAIKLLWTSFAVGFVGSLGGAFVPVEGLSVVWMVLITLFGWAISFGISYWLLTAAWRGKSWSRWVQAVLYVFGTAFVAWLSMAEPDLADPWYLEAINVTSFLLDAAGIGMLFAPTANTWYRAMREAR